jgi:hypothetical protein
MSKESFIWIENIQAAQVPNTLNVFSKIIKDFDLIVEIGTNRGGFSIWLNDNKKESCQFLTYDINKSCVEIPTNHRAYKCIRYADCFSTPCIEYLKNLIQTSGRALFLCDGGNKVKEFNIYSEFLKPNDVIMLHDYANSPNEIENWNNIKIKYDIVGAFHQPESSFSEIINAVEKNKLQKFMYNEFLNIFWGSFIKL